MSNKSKGNLANARRLSDKCRNLQRMLQRIADQKFGEHKPFVGLPLPTERGFACIVSIGHVGSHFEWLTRETDVVASRLEMALDNCLEFIR